MRAPIFISLVMLSLLTKSLNSKRKSEDRIVGGFVTEGDDRPPFMAIFNFKPSSTVKCTSSIISPYWLISAAHCLVDKKHFETVPCLQDINVEIDAVCERVQNDDILVKFPGQKVGRTPEVFIDVDDMMEISRRNYKHKKLVQQIIIHRDGYQGGMYGEYGGYDIILIKLSEPVNPNLASCLPGLKYRTQKEALIGGYGRYRRVPCETTEKGPQVFEYCKVDPTCVRGSSGFQSAKCDVQFSYQDREYNQCIRDQPTPSALDPECEKFREAKDVSDKWMERNDVNEIVILDKHRNVKTSCYRKNAGRHGWCGVTQNVFTGKKESVGQEDSEVSSNSGWGVCSGTCDEEYQEKHYLTGKARIKPVQIMEQSWCDERLASLRYGLEKKGQTHGFWVFPLVFCVALNETYKTRFYRESGSGSYREEGMTRKLMKQLGRDDPYYIRATGSCKGDSGGPLYETVDGKYVVIGTTSRGTGPIGNCGGRGNPTHYVQVQAMIPWITNYVKDVCLL